MVKRPGPTREALYQSPVPRKTHYMPPAVTAWVHAIADGTAARGTIEVLALTEPLNYHHDCIRLSVVVGFQSRGSRTHLSHGPRFRAFRLRVLLQGRRATVGLVERQLGRLPRLHDAPKKRIA